MSPTTRRTLPAKDAVLVTVGFLYDSDANGEQWDIWLGGWDNKPKGPGAYWTPAATFLRDSDTCSTLARVPLSLLVVARPTPEPFRAPTTTGGAA